MTTRALCFDLDDTLYGYAACNELGLIAAHRVLLGHSQKSFEEFMLVHDRVRLELAAELKGQAASHNRAIFFKRMVERLVNPGRGGLAVELFDTYWQSFLSAMSPAPAAREVLDALGREYSLALVSNHTTDIQLRKLRALQLETCFPVVVTSEEAGVEKPNARIFELALTSLGTAAGETVMIGDSPRVDLRGARAAGMRCVLSREFVSPADSEEAPEGVIDTLAQLPELLARI